VDKATLQVPLSTELSDNEAIVLLTYQGMRQGSGPETCVNTYQVIKRPYGWTPANGSGLCRQDLPGQDNQDLEISSGRYPGKKPQEPGYSLVYGLVNNPEIQKVRVTWDDKQSTEVEAGSGAYLAHRSGQFLLRAVEGLDDQDQVVFSHFTDLDPDDRR
jgi:hypothetical protein